jgi:hypothetical protein
VDLNVVFDSFNNVVPKVVAYANQNGLHTDKAGLLAQSLVERKHAFWELHFRNPDPALAQKVANYWTQLSYADLQSRQQAGNIKPALFYQIVQPAGLPTSQVNDRMNVFVLSGAALGFILGYLMISLPFFGNWMGKLR